MKIVFCGPPHSGKSVFVANLIYKMPSDGYTIIRACPDGEGTWSNNQNQNETTIVRKKGKFTKSFIDDACNAIDNQVSSIVLVDVGGVMSPENEQIFKHCDGFVVLSSDEQKKKEWLEFGEKLGLECVGCLDSSLEGQEEIYEREPYLKGRITGLERGEQLDSKIINAVASDIIKKSKYIEKNENLDSNFDGVMIDDTELGFKLGYGKEILTDDGIPIKKVRWKEEAVPEIYNSVQETVKKDKAVRVNGIRANFAICAICKASKEKGVKDISAYDIRTKSYIPIKKLPKKRGIKQSEGLSYNIIENNENIFIDFDITGEQYTVENYEKCILPKIKEGKNLYLSGRIPLWLLASISISYDSDKIFTFQPGKGFTCISSFDEKDLGSVMDGIDGIDINQYFDDKRDKNKAKVPEVVKKQGLFDRIKRYFIRNNENNNEKYINSSIQANIVSQDTKGNVDIGKLQNELDKISIPKSNEPNIKKDNNVNRETKIPTGIGE